MKYDRIMLCSKLIYQTIAQSNLNQVKTWYHFLSLGFVEFEKNIVLREP